jgi:hypothetical protein
MNEMNEMNETHTTLRALLDWRMCSDPWPGGDMSIVDDFLNSWCAMAGFSDWVDAYHRLPPNDKAG